MSCQPPGDIFVTLGVAARLIGWSRCTMWYGQSVLHPTCRSCLESATKDDRMPFYALTLGVIATVLFERCRLSKIAGT